MATHLVYISPGHMDPTYEIERAGLGPDVELRVMSNPDRGDMDGAETREAARPRRTAARTAVSTAPGAACLTANRAACVGNMSRPTSSC